MDPYIFKFCLCKDCFLGNGLKNNCIIMDDQYYLLVDDELINVEFKMNKDQTHNNIQVDSPSVLKFFKYMASLSIKKKYFAGYYCCSAKYIKKYMIYISQHNMVDHIVFFMDNPTCCVSGILKYTYLAACCCSSIDTMESILNKISISDLCECLAQSLYKPNKIVFEYLLDKYQKFLESYFTGKKYRCNFFRIDNANISDTFHLQNIINNLMNLKKIKNHRCDTFIYAIDNINNMISCLKDIRVKKDLIVEYNQLISNSEYDQEIKNSLLISALSIEKIDLLIVRQLILDGADIFFFDNEMHSTIFSYTINIIINTKNLDLLDLLFEMKFMGQSEINDILLRSHTKSKSFVKELINYGADIDSYRRTLYELAYEAGNKKLTTYLSKNKN